MYVVTHPVTADVLLRGQLTFMRERGFEVSVVSAPGPELDRVREREGVETVVVPMVRNNDAKADVVSLARMVRVLERLRPDIVNAGTPKGGLLGMIAARTLSVPVRIYLLRGLRLETVHGVLRPILAATERIASTCAHDVACVSPSLRDISVAGGYISKRKATIIGAGSSNGVDTTRFQRTPELRAEGTRLLESLGVPSDAPLVGFVGRLVADKGIAELLDAFAIVKREVPAARLVLLGGDLGDEVADASLVAKVRAAEGVVATPKIRDLAPYYARIDVLGFPSFREGFPNVVMEAASAEVPVVGFRSTGVVDGIVDGETGAIVDQRDVAGLARGITRYLKDPKLAAAHGRTARARTERLFRHEVVWNAWFEAYEARLRARGLPLPKS
ncbi:Alpha-1,3-N-acetylgalactosamine transferase PglA [Labilithrix luteola]|uniref:Alpha-1,3-N-acetylgalactosamine transferase PglA n=1 Tax=Labilithrix luteola TaxID=1391654 RepID=A0A0K1Q5R0_9BACT|nr:Alpha-1,3-N-acetylgalactosamine transferase PglA [Labilithrix luteola]